MGFLYAGADFTYPLLSHEKALKLIGLLGFDGVDIGLFQNRSHLQPSMIKGNAANHGRLVKVKADDAGIIIADVFLQSDTDFGTMAVNHPDKSIREKTRWQFMELIEFSNSCNSRHITCLPGVVYENDNSSLSRCQEELAWRVEAAKSANLVLGVEPHIGSIIDSPDKALRLVESVPGLTFTLDYTHFAKTGVPDSEVEPMIKYASHFHARGAKPGALQTTLTDNTIDYKRIVEVMKQTNYSGFIGVEYIWIDWENCNRSDNVSESIQLMQLMKEAELVYG